MMSIDNNAYKQKSSLRWLWLAVAAVFLLVLSAVGRFFLIPLLYPEQPPQDKMAQILTEPPPPPPPPPPVSSSPQASVVVGSGHPAAQSPAHPRKVVLSSAVAQSLLIQNSSPRYPPIAKAARVSGTVVLHAVISTTGSVINLQAVSGPGMLQQAALDAVKSWKYRPYLLNNQPVEFETTVNVIFTLGE
jgi:periplasmic protein TonB